MICGTSYLLSTGQLERTVLVPANAPVVQCIFDKRISYSVKVLGSTIRLPPARSNVTELLNTVSKMIPLIFITHVFKACDGKSENIIKMEIKM